MTDVCQSAPVMNRYIQDFSATFQVSSNPDRNEG